MSDFEFRWEQSRAADALAEVIRQPLHDLNAAAEEAEKGRLGGAKLGVLVAASGILRVLRAIDAEFERQRGVHATDGTTGADAPKKTA